MANLAPVDLRDPFQGFDIKVSVTDVANAGERFSGAFTGFMARITCQTEAYLPLGERTPRMLDGEITVVWSLEQALVNDRVLTHTFGADIASAYAKGRQSDPVPRQTRFNIHMETTTAAITEVSEAQFRSDLTLAALKLKLNIWYARVDTGSFGVMAGKRMASSSWQGTAEFLNVG